MTLDQPDAPPPVNVNFRRRDPALEDGWITLEGELTSPTGWTLVILASALERHRQELEDYAKSLKVSFQVSAHEEPEGEALAWAEPTIATGILIAQALQEDPDSPHILLQTYVPSDKAIDVTLALLVTEAPNPARVRWTHPGPGRVTVTVYAGAARLDRPGYGGSHFAWVGNPAGPLPTSGTCYVTVVDPPCDYRLSARWTQR